MAIGTPLVVAASCVLLCLTALSGVHTQTLNCPGANFGPNCSLSCADYCDSETNCVTTSTGGCTVNCQKGFENFPLCNKECEPNRFSFNCSEQCHCANATETCDRKNGNCQSGCQPEWAESSCSVRLPVVSTPPWILNSDCSSFLVAFRPFNSSVDIGVGHVAQYMIEWAIDGKNTWYAGANVSAPGPYQARISFGSANQTLRHRFRLRILYRSPTFYERFAPAGNLSEPAEFNCENTTTATTETTEGTSTTTSTSTVSSTAAHPSTEASTTIIPDSTTETASETTETRTTIQITSSTESTPDSTPDLESTRSTDAATTSPAKTSSGTTWSQTAAPQTQDNTVLIVLLVLLFLALFVGLAILLYRLRAHRFNADKKYPLDLVAMRAILNFPEPKSARLWTKICELDQPRWPVFSDQSIAELKQTSASRAATDSITFKAEFDFIPRGYQPKKSLSVARRVENAAKNVSPFGLPYDSNRVTFSDDENVYYNASIVKGYVRRDAYIVAQSPNDATSAELLWRAVLEQNVAQVVATERKKHLKYRYWPESAGQILNFGRISVQFEKRQPRHEFVMHRLRVNGMRVTHYQLVCPHNDTLGLVAMYTAVRAAARIEDGPMLVHCPTGIGSACVFICLDWLLQQAARENGGVSVYKCVRELRRSRPNALPNARQYALLYDTLFEAHLRRGFPLVSSTAAIDAFLANIDHSVSPVVTTPLKEQLDRLTRFGPALDDPLFKKTPAFNAIAFDSYQEVGAVHVAAIPAVHTWSNDAATVASMRNAFWLDVLQRRVESVVFLDGAAVTTTAIFPEISIAEVNTEDEKPLFDLLDLQIFLASRTMSDGALVAADSGDFNGKRHLLNIRTRQKRSTNTPATEPDRQVELLVLSWAAAGPGNNDSTAEEALIGGLARSVAAVTSTRTPCLVVEPDSQRCGLFAVTLQAWKQLIEDGYADVCSAVRRYQRRQVSIVRDAREYRQIFRCLQLLASWHRREPLPEDSEQRKRHRRRQTKEHEKSVVDDEANNAAWRGFTSTMESGGDELESSIFDLCQLPVAPRAPQSP